MPEGHGKPLNEGYQPKDRLGYQPPIAKKGYQPSGTGKPVGQNPPKMDSSAERPKASTQEK